MLFYFEVCDYVWEYFLFSMVSTGCLSSIADGGFNDTGEYWRSAYEDENFEEDLKDLLDELRPLYVRLHSYVRSKLKETYKDVEFPKTGHIPAHLLGKRAIYSVACLDEDGLIHEDPSTIACQLVCPSVCHFWCLPASANKACVLCFLFSCSSIRTMPYLLGKQ